MTYQANLMCNGEPILSCDDTDSNKLLAWLLTQLEVRSCSNTIGVIRNVMNEHELPRIYTIHNAHFD